MAKKRTSKPKTSTPFSINQIGEGKFARWRRDDVAEVELSKVEITFLAELITCKEIDWKTSRLNYGRLDRLVSESKIEDYAFKMEEGITKCPMVVVSRGSNGFTIVSGYHRLTSQQLYNQTEQFPVMVVRELTADEYLILSHNLNRYEGDKSTKETAIAIAIQKITRDGGKNIEETCRLLDIRDPKYIKLKYRHKQLQKQIVSTGCRVGTQLSEVQLAGLYRVKDNENVLVAACEAVVSHGLSGDETKELTNGIKGRTTEVTKLAFVENAQKEIVTKALEKKQEKRSIRPLYSQIKNRLSYLIRVLDTATCIEDLDIVENSNDHKQLKNDFRIVYNKAKQRLG